MKRTNILLPPNLAKKVKYIAKASKFSVNRVGQQAVENGLPETKRQLAAFGKVKQ